MPLEARLATLRSRATRFRREPRIEPTSWMAWLESAPTVASARGLRARLRLAPLRLAPGRWSSTRPRRPNSRGCTRAVPRPRARWSARCSSGSTVSRILDAFAAVLADRATAAATAATARWRAHRPLGPLDGVPYGVKDLIATAVAPTTGGSPLYEGHVADRPASVVRRLDAAGAVLLGSLHTFEFALRDRHGGPGRNPWDLDRSTGGPRKAQVQRSRRGWSRSRWERTPPDRSASPAGSAA